MPDTTPTKPQPDDKSNRGSGQDWAWVVLIAFIALMLGLVVYMRAKGQDATGQLIGIIAAITPVAAAAMRLIRKSRWSPRSRFPKKAIVTAAIALLALVILVIIIRPNVGPGRTVTDDGRAFGPGGSSQFTVTIDPANKGVRVTRRLDAGIAMQIASLTVNGMRAGMWQPLPIESRYRWKDQSIDISPSLTAGRRSLTITNTFVSSTQDFNEFTYYISNKVNDKWPTTDVLDVGNTTSETSHHYHIIHQTFAGLRTYKYER